MGVERERERERERIGCRGAEGTRDGPCHWRVKSPKPRLILVFSLSVEGWDRLAET
jgi:hypothetical protein